MVAVAWTEGEGIALCESWVEALSHHTPGRRSSGPFWRTIRQQFQAYTGENNRAVNSLSSRFRTIRLIAKDSRRFTPPWSSEGGDFGEDDIIQVILINFKHMHHREFNLRLVISYFYFMYCY
ncbi:hypothetical protein Hanom_Chr17g01525291 [Helianthus anomalus]